MKIIPMTTRLLDDVFEIEKQSFASPWTREALEKEITENDCARYIAAVNGSEVIGYAGMWHIVNEGHITNIAVAPHYRRKGVAQALLDELINHARKKDMIGVTLECRVGNFAAKSLYEKNGFKTEGIRKEYYSDTREDALVMWKYI